MALRVAARDRSLVETLGRLPRQLAQGFRTICFKPAMFVERADQVPDLCAELVAKAERIARDVP